MNNKNQSPLTKLVLATNQSPLLLTKHVVFDPSSIQFAEPDEEYERELNDCVISDELKIKSFLFF
jgi:hypothetical protein